MARLSQGWDYCTADSSAIGVHMPWLYSNGGTQSEWVARRLIQWAHAMLAIRAELAAACLIESDSAERAWH